jgi:replicative DNA helicase
MKTMEQTILKNLLLSPTYMNDFLSYIKVEYMSPMNGHGTERVLVETIKDYFGAYKQQPTKTAIELQLQKNRHLSEEEYKDATAMLMTFDSTPDPPDYLYAETDKWIKRQAAHCALQNCIAIYAAEQEGKTLKSGMDMNKVMADVALAGRQTKIGHAYVGDAASRWDYYQEKDVHIPFDLNQFNRFTSGGLARKRIMGIMGDTGVGKSLVLCHFAASFVRLGYNVLYITFEMPSHEIAERIDANLLDVPLHTVRDLPRGVFDAKIAALRLPAEVVIEEYPEHGAGLNEFRALLKKMEQVRRFRPDVVLVDYLNKCGSSRFKFDSYTKHHEYYGSVANELYQLAKDFNVGVVCAIQTNRAAKSTDSPGTEHVAGSNKISEALNYLVAVEKDNEVPDQFKMSVPKNRHAAQPTPFVVKVDHSRMRLYNNVLEKFIQSDRSAEFYAKLKGGQGSASKH